MFVASRPDPSGLPVPDGKIAVTVPLTAPQRVAGYVQVGSKVAVFDTFNVAEGQGRTPAGDPLSQRQHSYDQATRLLLASVQVIALGPNGVAATTASSGRQSGLAAVTSTDPTGDSTVLVTVAVNQADAERLVQAAQTGALYLALLTEHAATAPSNGADNRNLF